MLAQGSCVLGWQLPTSRPPCPPQLGYLRGQPEQDAPLRERTGMHSEGEAVRHKDGEEALECKGETGTASRTRGPFRGQERRRREGEGEPGKHSARGRRKERGGGDQTGELEKEARRRRGAQREASVSVPFWGGQRISAEITQPSPLPRAPARGRSCINSGGGGAGLLRRGQRHRRRLCCH